MPSASPTNVPSSAPATASFRSSALRSMAVHLHANDALSGSRCRCGPALGACLGAAADELTYCCRDGLAGHPEALEHLRPGRRGAEAIDGHRALREPLPAETDARLHRDDRHARWEERLAMIVRLSVEQLPRGHRYNACGDPIRLQLALRL